jgi:O-acetylhomoserine (thiol)-lyase
MATSALQFRESSHRAARRSSGVAALDRRRARRPLCASTDVPRAEEAAMAEFAKFDTLSLHAGQHPDPQFGARAVPIYQTTSYVFRDTDHAAALFNLERAGHIYSRISNPTVAVLEERLAALEGGVGCVATASGQAALFLGIATLVGQGGHIVSSASIYGGSHNLFTHTLPRFGIATTFVNPRDTDGFGRAMRAETRLVFGETLGNPGLEVMDLPAVAKIAHDAGVPLMIDNTFATPYLCRPFEHGVDLVIHSATKFLGGHGIAIAGALVDSGQFDWEASGKFPTLTEPYAGYHGLDFAEEFGPAAFIMRARAEGLRDFGATMAPQTAFYILQGVETLHLRVPRHVANARRLAEFLSENPAVEWVSYPELPSHPDHERAKKLLPKGCGSIFSFGIKGGREAGRRFIESLQLFSHLANVGDAKSLVIHPASTTHQQMDAAALKAAGIGEELIRLSVGLEDPEDLVEDLSRALRASQPRRMAAE